MIPRASQTPINTGQKRTSNSFRTERNDNHQERRRNQANFNEFLETFLGGKGANQAVAAAQLNTYVCMIGQAGNDEFGSQLLAGIASRGVDVHHVSRVSGSSGVAIITTDDNAQNEIIVISGANSHLKSDFVDSHSRAIEDAAVVLAQLEIPMEFVVRAAEIAHHKKIPFILDPAPARDLPNELYSLVTWLTPNESESFSLLSEDSERDPSYVADKPLGRGVRNVVLKLGAAGVYVAGADVRETLIEGFEVNAVDSTAAGDAFNGAFAASIAHQVDPISAARLRGTTDRFRAVPPKRAKGRKSSLDSPPHQSGNGLPEESAHLRALDYS